jgi:septum formation protein
LSLSPFEYVLQTASKKAQVVYEREIDSPKGEPALLVAADTVIVTTMGEILEKPKSEQDHIAMLKKLRDQGRHRVFTAVVAMVPLESATAPGYALETEVEETVVVFDRQGELI